MAEKNIARAKPGMAVSSFDLVSVLENLAPDEEQAEEDVGPDTCSAGYPAQMPTPPAPWGF